MTNTQRFRSRQRKVGIAAGAAVVALTHQVRPRAGARWG
jgi:hypothetical protein